jgi:uncharacterized DUF497 family protein
MVNLSEVAGFQWDEGNADKNWKRHGVSRGEAEQVFFNLPRLLLADKKHSTHFEERYLALGQSNEGRRLSVVFTIRENLVRVISARDMSRKDRRVYEQENKTKT